MVEFLGYLSQFLFIGATFFQALKVYKDGHADGLSHALIWMLNFGFCVMVYYTIKVLNSDPVMLTGYVGQLIGFSYMTKMKYFPRPIDLPSAPLTDEEMALFDKLIEEEESVEAN